MRARSPLADLAVAGAVALSAAGVNVSCAGPTDDTLARVAIDTLDGGQVRVSNPDHGADPTLEDWWLEEELRIGVLQGESPELFGDVGSLTADRNGAIYIADFQSAEIRVFDSDGGFLRRFGRRGEGPGEFRLLLRGMTLLWQHPDRLWIADAPHLSAFDSLGNLVGRAPHRIALSTHWSGQLDSAGFFYEEGVAQARGDSGMARRFIARFRASDDTNPVHTADTLGLPFVSRKTRLDRHDYGTQGILEVVELPMQPSVLWAVAPSGNVWLANSAAYVLHQVSFSGDTLRTVELRRGLERLEGAERDSLAEASGFSVDELPAYKLAVKSLRVAPDGWIWVEPISAPSGGRWDLFDPCGQYMGVVNGSESLEPWPIHLLGAGALLGVIRDELDVEYVVRLRIRDDRVVRRVRGCL